MSPKRDSTLATLRRELAESRAERDEALARESAVAEVLQVINSSAGDFAPVFKAILDNALRLCGAAFGNLLIYENGYYHAIVGVYSDARSGEQELARPPFKPPPQGALGRIMDGESIIFIEDVRLEIAHGYHTHQFRELMDAGGYRSMFYIALRHEDRLFGAIVIFFTEITQLTDKQVALLQSFAAQAVIAMENARLITETREALEQQTATAEVLGVINSSPSDLVPVFDAMLERAMRLCGGSFGAFAIYEGEHYRVAATRGLPPGLVEFVRNPIPIESGSMPDRLRRGENTIQVSDVTSLGPEYRTRGLVAMIELGQARTATWVGLRKDGVVQGFVGVYRQEVRPFTDKQIALLENFAAQAVIAMENARLLTETREALEQQTATAEVLQVVNSSPGDLAPVFDAMLEKALSLCDAAFGLLRAYDGERYSTLAAQGEGAKAEAQRSPLASPGSALARIAQGERVIHIPDLIDTDAYRSGVPSRRRMVDDVGARSAIWVALRKDDAILGVFVIYRTEVRAFADREIALLKNFAAQAVIAMENARLLGELRQRTEEVAELNRGLEARVAEQVDELGRVGRLKRFLAPQLAELIVSQGDESILESHRREIVVVFCDLRGYTAFTETAEPEEVLDFLREYHGALGPLVAQFEGTLDQFSGDGIMVFFNDPVPISDPAERAVKMAMAMREVATGLITAWRERGRELGFGVGIAQGYATLGQIGFSERSGYTAIGTVCNVAARLCGEAKDGQILLSQRVNVALRGSVATEQIGALALKGLTQPVVAYNVPLLGGEGVANPAARRTAARTKPNGRNPPTQPKPEARRE